MAYGNYDVSYPTVDLLENTVTLSDSSTLSLSCVRYDV